MDYKKIYEELIQKVKNEKRTKNGENYYESHHIIPKCLSGDGRTTQWKTHNNIILLTAKEHFVAHLLLCEIYPDNIKLKFALWSMCNQDKLGKRYIISSRRYERIKIETSKIRSELYKGRVPHNKGKPSPWSTITHKGKPKPWLSERNRLRKGIPWKCKEGWISPLKNKKQDKELIEKRAEGRKQNGKKVLQYTLDGEFIQEFRCITDAYTWLHTHIGKGDIRANIYGKTKSAGGFIWKYKKD
jgi:hypothetical protein